MDSPIPAARVFIGYDPRQAVAYNVLQHSLTVRASRRLSIEPLVLETLPLTRMGLTPFTYSRFLVPWLCNFTGCAVFLDADMLCLGDIIEVFDAFDPTKAVQVVQNSKRFEWSSMMLFNCEHHDNLWMTPGEIQETQRRLHTVEWTEAVGELPGEWNHTVFYDKPRPDAKLVHFTGGIPLHPETRGCEYSDEWIREAHEMNSSLTWTPLMGNSVHAQKVMQAKIKRDMECADAKNTSSAANTETMPG